MSIMQNDDFPMTQQEADARARAAVEEMIEMFKTTGEPAPRIEYHTSIGILIGFTDADEAAMDGKKSEAKPPEATDPIDWDAH